jgi:hypothetical protein
MSQSARQGRDGHVILPYPSLISQIFTTDGHPLSTLQEKSNLGDGSGRSSYIESMSAEDVDRTMAKLEHLSEDLGGIIAFVSPINRVWHLFALKLWTLQCGLMIVGITIPIFTSVQHLRPDSVTPHVTHAIIPIPSDSPIAEPPPFSLPILNRLLSLAATPISALLVGLSLRQRGDRLTRHKAWYQATLYLYFAALVKLLYDIDFGFLITAAWYIGFLSVAWHHLARSRAVAQTMRELRSLH